MSDAAADRGGGGARRRMHPAGRRLFDVFGRVRTGRRLMLPIIIIGALTAYTGGDMPAPTDRCAPAAIVVVHWSQPTPCDLDGSQTLVLVDTDQATADQVGGIYLGHGLTWDADY